MTSRPALRLRLNDTREAPFGRWRIMAKRIDDLYVSAIFWSYYSRTIPWSTADLEHFQNGLDRLC
jgi:hypothetical protein